MALQTYNVTLSGATQVSSTRQPLQQVIISPAAHDITIGKSNVATVPGATLKATATQPLVIGSIGATTIFDVLDLFIKGTDGDVVQVLVVTL